MEESTGDSQSNCRYILNKMEEFAGKTEEALTCRNEELKCLREVISEMKQQQEKDLEPSWRRGQEVGLSLRHY